MHNSSNSSLSLMTLFRPNDKKHEALMGEIGFKKISDSVISANNSLFNTPMPHSKLHNSLYPNMTEQKQAVMSRNLFAQQIFSPFRSETKPYSHIEIAKRHNLIGSFLTLGKRQSPQSDLEI